MLLPVLQALSQEAIKGEPTVLSLSFDDQGLNTDLRLMQGQIVALRSKILPPWSVSLIAQGVHPATIAEAQQAGINLQHALIYLLDRDYLSREQLADAAQERALSALLPLAWQTSRISSVPWSGAPAHPPLNSTQTQHIVDRTEWHAALLTPEERSLRPSSRFTANPLSAPALVGDDRMEHVYHAALRGLSLGDISQRLPQRWDILTQTVGRLVREGALRPQDAAVPRQLADALQAGQAAPDFCLPDLSGGELRLSALRGQPVWLVFNRQSTCAICNPHHAKIIAMHGRLRERGVQIVSIWGSPLEDLQDGIGRQRPPYPVLADPHDETYDRYGLRMSLRGTLDPRNLSTVIQGIRMMGTRALKDDGELLRMPAEFLIGADGVIETAHYNSYGSDWLPMERVLSWADHQNQSRLSKLH
ncbi:peroxiredoxin-like family protein [Deinococcus arenicola]|uniref:Peroxiredoxin-like family protein n=1 Tax=Deinococcus arenicola TaxID=2994950 RepID=A0ABU4DPS6_9DEIO|nr:peroxiredoxin-like family protein [Deinococcus sp. ZS9-10]MDV6374433.1 peroxiredoxin-like family protein [Deinococcus sp. ZS9-10]